MTGPTGERVTVEVLRCVYCGEMDHVVVDGVRRCPKESCRGRDFRCVTATLTGRDALVMEWARSELDRLAAYSSLHSSDPAGWTAEKYRACNEAYQSARDRNRRATAALAAFDAPPAEGDET